MTDLGAVQNLLAGWWFDYDRGAFDEWPRYGDEDAPAIDAPLDLDELLATAP